MYNTPACPVINCVVRKSCAKQSVSRCKDGNEIIYNNNVDFSFSLRLSWTRTPRSCSGNFPRKHAFPIYNWTFRVRHWRSHSCVLRGGKWHSIPLSGMRVASVNTHLTRCTAFTRDGLTRSMADLNGISGTIARDGFTATVLRRFMPFICSRKFQHDSHNVYTSL